jgi:Ca2+-transporting ATPase
VNKMTEPRQWHTKTSDETERTLEVKPATGLSVDEVQTRQEHYGRNELIDRGAKSPFRILLDQFRDTMVIILLAAGAISLMISDWKDAVAILAIVLLNAILGFVQEYRAERAMAALKQMAVPSVKVRRNQHVVEINAKELVPGDVILIEAGNAIPADARLIEVANLRVEEAALTGESLPVEKKSETLIESDIPLGDRHNMIYMGTLATYGRGQAIVVETGMRTELGRIAELIQSVGDEQTPLQRRMSKLGKTLAFAALGIVVLVFVLGLIRGEDPAEMFLTAIAMAVAAIPEGLPAVVAISLALGAQRMLRRQALIRNLPAVETLGSITVICSDKTGTLTENRMKVRVLDVAGHTHQLTDFSTNSMVQLDHLDPTSSLLLVGGALVNDAILEYDTTHQNGFVVIGDPTEGALLTVAAKYGIHKTKLEEILPRRAEIPFSSERKRMSTLHEVNLNGKDDGIEAILRQIYPGHAVKSLLFTKGSVDGLLEISDRVWVNGGTETLNPSWQERIEKVNNQMAGDGLRVLGVAMKPILELPSGELDENHERDLLFVGMLGMIDPPRSEAMSAVANSQAAGIRTMMITGDHPLTARRIAQDLGISKNDRILTGQELNRLSPEELESVIDEVSVYARVSPEHKLDIVEALQKKGHIVAMTGDGVNDAPALRKSDIGVAMGINGTDVSKEAADMVLLDDNFATIVNAIEEGRAIYDNVRKFIKYTMTSNAGEIYAMLFAPFLGMPLPLSALQILWINLVTDGLPGLALSLEGAEENTMRRPPNSPKESILARGMGRHILWVGLLMGLVSLGVGLWGWTTGNPYWQTLVFNTLTLSQMGHALAIRSEHTSLFKQGLFSNRALIGAILLTFVLQMLVIYWKPLQSIFDTLPLPPLELAISFILSLTVFLAVEVEKWFKRRQMKTLSG